MRKPSKYSKEWNRYFAWFPKEVEGQSVWLEHYEMRYVEKDLADTGCNCPCHISGWWEFRLPQAL
jgi:hypothetical protein